MSYQHVTTLSQKLLHRQVVQCMFFRVIKPSHTCMAPTAGVDCCLHSPSWYSSLHSRQNTNCTQQQSCLESNNANTVSNLILYYKQILDMYSTAALKCWIGSREFNSFLSSIHNANYLYVSLEPIPGTLAHKAGYTLDGAPIYWRTQIYIYPYHAKSMHTA